MTSHSRFAPIDVGPLRTALAELHSPQQAVRDAAVDRVRSAAERFPPPVLCALAHTLFRRGEREEAVFWYHAGQLRARFDVERCADPTVADALTLLRRQYGEPINDYAFVVADLALLRTTGSRVLAWDRKTPHAYDHRWVNLHGVRAFGPPGADVVLSRPRSQWPAIAERIRADYRDEMQAVLRDLEHWEPLSA